MAENTLDFSAILNDIRSIAIKSVRSAAKKTQRCILEEAKNYLNEYYNNYTPRWYKRTYRLRRAIIPYWAERTTNKNISIEIGVSYDSSALKGAYRSNSWYHQNGNKWIDKGLGGFNYNSPNNGIPEPEWILNNFLEGIHPWGQTDSESTDSLMKRFFDTQLPDKINQYIQEDLISEIVNRL